MTVPPSSLRRLTLATLLVLATALPAHADAPASRQQVPGYYHQAIGTVQVTALFDGLVPLQRKDLKGIEPDAMNTLLQAEFVPETDAGIQTAVNAYLIRHGNTLTLVDTGTARCFGPGLGQVLGNLRAAGYAPEQVDNVLLTHAHPDHMCGLLDSAGNAAYPKAQVWLAREDADYWLDPATEHKPDTRAIYRPLFKMARDAVAPYQAGKRLHLFTNKDALPDAITAVPSHGHSPGHTSFLIDAGAGQSLLVWGDVLHYHAVQFQQPDAAFEADYNRKQAITARRDLLGRASAQRWWVAGAHLPFPGLGHVRTAGDGYAWVRTEYGPLPEAGK